MRKVILHSLALALLTAAALYAHCDSLDGPVVNAARKALAAENVNLVLPWVSVKDEAAIRAAFIRTLSVRKLNPEAKDLADTWFFETLVRIHRAGEGAPFEGLKPAGSDFGPAISGAEKAIESGSDNALIKTFTAAIEEGIHHRFHVLLEAKDYKPNDLKAGREYVAAYVDFLHFAERLHQSTTAGHMH